MDVQKMIDYREPLDVAQLFTAGNIDATLEHVFYSFVKRVREAQENGDEYIYDVVGDIERGVLHVDYAFLIGQLSELVENSRGFKEDFSIKGSGKNNAFLVYSILEKYLNIVRMNSYVRPSYGKASVKFTVSFFVPIIVKTSWGEYAQMSSVIFHKEGAERYLSELLVKEMDDYFKEGDCMQQEGVFGARQASKFWKETGAKFKFIGNV